MDEQDKDILMTSVTSDEFTVFKNKFNQYNLNVQDDSFFDYDLLKAALARKHKAIANFLLKVGCRVRNPNKTNPEETPLHLAMKLNYSTITTILKNGASIYDKNHKGETALHAAFKEMYSSLRSNNFFAINAILNYLCSKDSEEANSSLIRFNPANKDDIFHFHIACIWNKVDVVKLYLKYGFDINRPLSLDFAEFNGLYPLHYAAIRRYIKLFEYLLQHGADISIPNGKGETTLHILYNSVDFTVNQNRDMISRVFRYGNSTKFVNSLNNGVSHLHICCITNYPDCVQVFLNNGVDINSAVPMNGKISCSWFFGFTPLHFAVFHGQEKVVKLLLKNGADCERKDKNSLTVLHVACRFISSGFVAKSIVSILLDYNACASAVDENGQTPLHAAFYNLDKNETKIFDMVVSKIPWGINFSDSSGVSHFHIVSANNYIDRVESFLKSGVAVDSSVESGRFDGYTALHFAVLYSCRDVVEILLKWNAQVNIKTSKEQLTPLHIACNYFKLIFVETKCERDNLDELTKHIDNQLKIIELLLLHGADVNARNYLGQTPLLYTFMSCYSSYFASSFNFLNNYVLYQIHSLLKEITKILLSNKANINARTDRQESIIHIIIENCYLQNSEELLEFCKNKGADIHAANIDGFTPLHIAVKTKNKMFIQFFLKHKVNINAKSKDFKTPLNLLLNNFTGHLSENDIFLLLLENGSDVNVKYASDKILWLDAISKKCSYFYLENLLNYGADINVEDSLGNPLIVSIFSKWGNEVVDLTTKVNAFYIIFIHLQKLLAADFHVNEEVHKCCIKLNQYYRSKLNIDYYVTFQNMVNFCVTELDKMKLVKIDNYTSLHSILLKDTHELSRRVKNRNLVKILEDKTTDCNYQLYSSLLKAKFKQGLIRSEVLKSANASLFFVIGFPLPDLCYDLILKHLTNEEIANLKAAAVPGIDMRHKEN